MEMGDVPFSERRWCSVRHATQYSGKGKTKVHEELSAGRIESKLEGGRRLVSVPSLIARCECAGPDKGRAMTDRNPSCGRDLALEDPARSVSEGDDPLDLRPRLQALLAKYCLHVAETRRLAHGWQVRTSEGPVINIFLTVTVQLQGQRTHLARELVGELRAEIAKLRMAREPAGRPD
jgi:hypothetical protein